jgi:hypothetical protein
MHQPTHLTADKKAPPVPTAAEGHAVHNAIVAVLEHKRAVRWGLAK